MTAADIIAKVRAAGVEIHVEGDDLVLEAVEPTAPPAAGLLERLKAYKPQILAALRPSADGWTGEDWRVFFDERAGIGEYDCGMSRPEAEGRSYISCEDEWMYRNPVVMGDAERCQWCLCEERPHDQFVPLGIASAGRAWVHRGCSPAWAAGRRAEAARALAALGIVPPG